MNLEALHSAIRQLRRVEETGTVGVTLTRADAIALLDAIGLVYAVGRAENGVDQTGLDISGDTFAACSDVADVVDKINATATKHPTPA